MDDAKPKSGLSPYVSFNAFLNFLNQLREMTPLPGRVDRTLLPKASGSLFSALTAALRSFKLIDDSGRPNETMRRLVHASDEERKDIFKELFTRGYAFLLEDKDFHLETATTGQLAQKFRDQGMSGSTVTKSIAFFLLLAKAAEVKVSPHLKAPPIPRTNGKRIGKAQSKRENVTGVETDILEDDDEVERFEIPMPGKPSVRVIVPKELDADDWEMLQMMIAAYIKRWKGFKAGGDE